MESKPTRRSGTLMFLCVGIICLLIGFLAGKYSTLNGTHAQSGGNSPLDNPDRANYSRGKNTGLARGKGADVVPSTDLGRKVAEAEREYEAKSSKENAQALLERYDTLAREKEKNRNIEELVDIFRKGDKVESESGLSGSERGVASFIKGHLIHKWVHADGDLLLRYLHSSGVSTKEKIGVVDYLREVIEKEYPGKKQEDTETK